MEGKNKGIYKWKVKHEGKALNTIFGHLNINSMRNKFVSVQKTLLMHLISS